MRRVVFSLGLCSGLCLASVAIAGQRVPEIRAAAEAPLKWSPSGSARIKLLARGENAFVGMLRMEAGAVVPEHQDATEEYIVIIEGGGTIIIDGKQYELNER